MRSGWSSRLPRDRTPPQRDADAGREVARRRLVGCSGRCTALRRRRGSAAWALGGKLGR